MKITETVWRLAEPIVAAQGCTIWDVEYVREGADRFLRIYIDKDSGVDIRDCEAVSRAMDPVLDEADPIAESYNFEVCSAGIERVLKRAEDFERFCGSKVLVRLYAPADGAKEFVGELVGFDDGAVTIRAADAERRFEKQQVALVRLYAEF
ncbi:MAG: ribosome maturation factor RimP [Oscillospiraceae bacterium]|nr:ribosome maturation factor RimP [Oscillospiraceae bacterium]MBR2080089.1 ribosome maturation factor RimP [Oscillospiraceae bacterium]MBR2366359.1 ribosome maturation factor RimP [Oscillospiraceae bacterium]MBR2897694.1 ribosome maturation factor RimP [Oscillospiraceae bacterium]MBR2977502.1 ribosome maturation factor RimP [Oscillospiraceae bacterium]